MVLGIILAIIALIPVLIGALGYWFSTRPYKGPETEHFRGGKFHNPGGVQPASLRDVFKFVSTRDPQPWVKNYEDQIRKEPIGMYDGTGIRFYFINHSSFLLQIGGKNILVDPIWSERCSPVSWAGPARMRPPGVAFDALPGIDLVLLSHNHYDHCDLPTLRDLSRTHTPEYVVALGMQDFLRKKDLGYVSEMDWWEEKDWQNLKIRALPAIHFSGRGMFDRNKSLWCGYLIESGNFRIWYVGDTGYGPVFRDTSEKIGPVDLAFIPIGAYLPRWMMSPIHISPGEAVQMHLDIRSTQSVAMHFGCFPLGDEGHGGAEEDLRRGLQEAGVAPDRFIIPDEGREYVLA